MAQLRMVRGQIVAVQEQRFRMVTDSGQGLLLTLSNRAHVPAAFMALGRVSARVQVWYEGQPNLTSGVAKKVKFL